MSYSLSTHYAGQGLLDRFSFFTGEDPNSGFVNYQSREAALASNLVSIDELNRVKLAVDSINTYSTSDKGRPSVRLTSDEQFTHGLFIADFAHMPGSTCGTWPAFWAFNNAGHWPAGGEVDIIEGANRAQKNLFTAHTAPGCEAPSTGFTGIPGPTDCSIIPDNVGCNYAAPKSGTYGDSFNVIGGGVYAMEWDSQDIKIWHFPRMAIPYDIRNAPIVTPDPTRWGPPQARFGGSECDTDSHFYNMSLVINTNFCGAYAGNIWGVADKCDKLAPTCEEYVAGNPRSFRNSFWEINYIDVYKKAPPSSGSSPSRSPSRSTPTSVVTRPTVLGNNTATPSRTRTVTISVSTAQPTPTSDGLPNPTTIDDWTLLGCFGSLEGYKSFSQVASYPSMDNEACVSSCAGHKYAGVSNELRTPHSALPHSNSTSVDAEKKKTNTNTIITLRTCYCADALADATAVPNKLCSVPCPGKPTELCGGVLTTTEDAEPPAFANLAFGRLTNVTSLSKSKVIGVSPRDASNPFPRAASPPPPNVLLTVYGKIDEDVPPPAPAMGGTSKAVTSTTTTTTTVTFVTVCPTDAAKLITMEYCATLTAAQAVPMTTYVQACEACGPRGADAVTLTVPQPVAAGTASGHVVAIAVETVVPVLAAHNTSSANTSSPGVPIMPVPTIPVPVPAGASTVERTFVGFMRTLGYGLGLWFAVFGIGVLL
ncbi:glycoside hydrolase family 16 protein [Xylaria bambusicola]|uniref:glycoside hydrolase family 16 protein n=1 Tax=Xylaria bambusicola TaxID=326684 RepID=UPI0020073C04|nr:glycoside hydrolase family 16 protein [Xylaria bambusicola]KAI0523681.1 glycoside hydrolase family 16 protein [Xylaria bambusicola]